MNKLLSIILFILFFIGAYVALCYLMPIKLSAEPWEYFVASAKHMVWLKFLIALIVGLAMSIVPSIIKKKQ
ncbi:MAG: hypothetical protein IJZ35_07385 [Clostridia bacterium]|nr:hypothetical protein [Clostridia bacterium]